MTPDTVRLSPIDEARFGIRTARATGLTQDDLPEVLAFCHTHAVQLLIARTPVAEVRMAQRLETLGFQLMDTLTYYGRDLRETPIPPDAGSVLVRSIRTGEGRQVETVAAAAFQGYMSHYHADERLDPAKCDEVYPSWALLSCTSKEMADEVLVADLDGVIVGFSTLRLHDPDEGEVRLFAVAPQAQRQGFARSLMIQSMAWMLAQGRRRLLISTQITNYAQQKLWVRIGFEPLYAYYTFHKWFD